VIEVDVPLAFFSTFALLYMVRITERPSMRNYLLAGLFAGLAVSTKYTALVLVLPLAVSHLLAVRAVGHRGTSGGSRPERRWRWAYPGMALAMIALTFFVTSPFVLLDHSTFLRHLSLEREHMREGHFGLERAGTILFYIRALSQRIRGWPLLVLAAGGVVYRLARSRRPSELVLLAFAVPYCIVVATWSMKADRYLMPVLPVALVFSAAAFDGMLSLPVFAAGKRRIAAAIPLTALIERTANRPQYAVQPLPMLQVYPERTAVFYDMRLYPDADIFVTSSAITSRYYREPERFPSHVAFYDDLEEQCVRIGEFRGRTGPTVTLYKVRWRSVPFGGRRNVEGPRLLRQADTLSGGTT
jgi:hypothetical protein